MVKLQDGLSTCEAAPAAEPSRQRWPVGTPTTACTDAMKWGSPGANLPEGGGGEGGGGEGGGGESTGGGGDLTGGGGGGGLLHSSQTWVKHT